MGKSKKKSYKPKSEDTNQEKLYLLHMDLYGPIRVESVNGKKYILVIINDYSRFTWVKCLRSKDEAPDFRIKFLKMIQVRLKSNYVLEILKKYGMESCDPVCTPMEIKDKLDLDQNGTPVDATKYHSMIGALMYLTSSRPDIVHATCLCARYQAKPTEKHIKEVKRIFRYIRGTINTGLWYSKDSGFELTGFSDADYAGCKDTFKSTSGGAQFLGKKMVSWSLKKQDCTTLSTAKAEYVSLSA
nr:uncharacterized mitochondrial protein AtMg00810-like [Tanacetum cinerariifolium]